MITNSWKICHLQLTHYFNMQDVQHIKPAFGQLVIEHDNKVKYLQLHHGDGNGMRVVEAGRVPFGSLNV